MIVNSLYTVCSIVFLVLLTSACTPTNGQSDLARYEATKETAKKAFYADNFDEAFDGYKASYEIAVKMRWREGQIHSKIFMSEIRVIQKNHAEAEQHLLDAKSICLQAPYCAQPEFESIANALMVHYILRTGDLQKASDFGREILGLRGKIMSPEDTDKLVAKYVSWVDDEMSTNEAETFRRQLKQ